MFPDTAYGFVSGGDPASIPALTYEKYQRVYRRHYSADNCCVTLYGKMDMAEKLDFLDREYLSKMPKGTSQPKLTLQSEQPGVCVKIPYYTEKPEADEVQCALAWYTGAFADRERQLGVEILLDALLGTNQSPLKAALLEEKLGADVDVGFDDSTLQPVLELVLRGATEETAEQFAPAVRRAVDGILADVRARGDGKLSKVAQGAAEDRDGTACMVGFAPHARVAAEGHGGTGGEIAQAAVVVEGSECAQAAGLGVVQMLQRARGLGTQKLAQADARLVRAVQIGVQRDDAHAAKGCLVQCRAALRTRGIGRTKGLGSLDVDGMMRQQHVGPGLNSAVHVGLGRIECAGNAGYLGGGVSYGQPYMIPALGIRLGIAL